MTVSLTRTPLVTRQDMRKVVQEENPGVTFGEVGKLLGAKWQEADEKTKKACARPVCASHAARCTRARRFAGSGGCSLPLYERALPWGDSRGPGWARLGPAFAGLATQPPLPAVWHAARAAAGRAGRVDGRQETLGVQLPGHRGPRRLL